MRLLIITQKIDEQDAVLGFMHGWILEFARQAESVIVVCLEKGAVNLPENVEVFSLGKESLGFRIWDLGFLRRVIYFVRFWYYIWSARRSYDVVFVHMNPEYIMLGGIFWKLWGKTVTLWYAHKSSPWHLSVAHFFTDIVFTSTASGFRLKSSKVKVIGQGIDINKFQITNSKSQKASGEFKIVTVGRITPSKDYDTLINAVEVILKNYDLKIHADIIGPTSVASDETYFEYLKEKIIQKGLVGIIDFRGPVANTQLPEALGKYDLFVNMGHTGSLDKAVPEAMAMGLPVLTCNEAFKEVLGPFTADLMYSKGDSEELSGKITGIAKLSEKQRQELGERLRAIVIRDHSLQAFVGKIIFEIESFKNYE